MIYLHTSRMNNNTVLSFQRFQDFVGNVRDQIPEGIDPDDVPGNCFVRHLRFWDGRVERDA